MKTNNKKRRRSLSERIMVAAVILSATMLPYSCLDDKGTMAEDYVALSELRIDTAEMGIKPSYTLLQSQDILSIVPDIYYKGELVTAENVAELPLDFSWVIYLQPMAGTYNYRIDTLSKAPSIKSVVNRGAGSYTCLLTVTDLETNIQSYCSFPVTVESNITTGYLVLYENADGDSDVGLILNDWINSSTTADRMMLDLFSGTNGTALPGKPVSIRHSERTITSGEVLIATEKNYVGVTCNGFEVTYPAASLFNEFPGMLNISYMGIGGNPGWTGTTAVREYLITDNKLYYTIRGNSSTTRATHTKLGQPMSGTYGELAPWCAMLVNTNTHEAIVYDQTNTCFRYVAYINGVELLPFAKETSGNPAFDITNTGMQMIASDWGYRTYSPSAPMTALYYEFSLMKSGTNRSLIVTHWSSTALPRAAASYNLNGYPGIQDATMIAAGTAGPVFYYSNGSAIYLLTHNVPARTIQPATEFWKPPTGEQITRIVMHKSASQMKTHPAMAAIHNFTKDNQMLYVATWNESTRAGTVYQINVDMSNGKRAEVDGVVVPERVYTGFGKIRDMCWKWPL